MNKREGVAFLFTIAKEIQISFSSPVIFFTQTDYAESIFTTMRNIHDALLKQEAPEKFAEIVHSFHIEWLEAVQDVEMFSKRIKDTPREVILRALDYTMNCTQLRYKHILEYIDEMHSIMTAEENQLMQRDLTIIKEMQHTVNSALLEKLQYIKSQADQTEYLARIRDEIEELLHWLDRLEDSLAIESCNVLNFKVPLAPSNLTKTLKQIIDEVAQDTAPEAQRVAEVSHVTSSNLLPSLARLSGSGEVKELEIAKLIEKIGALKARISRLRAVDSPALMALKYKTMFLEDRLQSLENNKMSMNKLRKVSWEQESDENIDEHRLMTSKIFNHLLPHQDRCRLVEKLILLWNKALTEKGHDNESVIDILSVVNVKEQYSDEIGNFTVDKFGRKIYTTGDGILYQLNDRNNLVPLSDDEKHIYLYDSCGRYYLDDIRQRIYKNHDGASEYMLDKGGLLLKVREEKDSIEYFYDRLGRYYVNAEGRHIYHVEDSNDEYERDGFNNLVKIREQPMYYAPCSSEPITMEENKYLRKEVGDALKKCIAEVVLHQPTDPIAYLADLLTKYSDNIRAHQKHLKDEQERFELSQLIHTTKDNSVNLSYADEATEDINFINYQFETDLSLTSF